MWAVRFFVPGERGEGVVAPELHEHACPQCGQPTVCDGVSWEEGGECLGYGLPLMCWPCVRRLYPDRRG